MEVWSRLLLQGLPYALVLEGDASASLPPLQFADTLEKALRQLNLLLLRRSDRFFFDLLLLARLPFLHFAEPALSSLIRRSQPSKGMHAYIISNAGARKLLSGVKVDRPISEAVWSVPGTVILAVEPPLLASPMYECARCPRRSNPVDLPDAADSADETDVPESQTNPATEEASKGAVDLPEGADEAEELPERSSSAENGDNSTTSSSRTLVGWLPGHPELPRDLPPAELSRALVAATEGAAAARPRNGASIWSGGAVRDAGRSLGETPAAAATAGGSRGARADSPCPSLSPLGCLARSLKTGGSKSSTGHTEDGMDAGNSPSLPLLPRGTGSSAAPPQLPDSAGSSQQGDGDSPGSRPFSQAALHEQTLPHSLADWPAYVINLPGDEERFGTLAGLLNDTGFGQVTRAAAINVSALTDLSVFDSLIDPSHESRMRQFPDVIAMSGQTLKLTRGEVGCALSHYMVWLDVLARGLPFAIVLEDDIQLTAPLTGSRTFVEVFKENMQEVNQLLLSAREDITPPDVIFIGKVDTVDPIFIRQLSPHIQAPPLVWCSYAYMVTRAGAEKLVRGFYLDDPVDLVWFRQQDPHVNFWAFDPPLAYHQSYGREREGEAIYKSRVRFGETMD